MTHPIDNVLVGSAEAEKSDVRTFMKDHTALRLPAEADAALLNLAGQKSLLIEGMVWDLDPADNVSSAAAGEVIVSNDLFRFKPAQRRLGPSDPPANSGSTGVAGTITWDSDYLYVCVATDTWKRVAIASW